MSSTKMSLVVAMNTSNRGIGVNGKIPWRLPGDLKHFARVTTHTQDPSKQNAVIMGRLTWLSIPKSFRPLPNRLNVLISSQLDASTVGHPDVLVFRSFDEAIETLLKNNKIEHIYAIGGSQIYRSALASPIMSRIYLTRVFAGDELKCDTFMEPANFLDSYVKLDDVPGKENFNVEFNKPIVENNLEHIYEVYEKI